MSVGVLELASSGKAENLLREMRVRSLWSPYYFSKVVLGYKDLVPHLHLHDSEIFLNRWQDGIRKQWIEWPRGFFKSTLFTISTGMWVVLPTTDDDNAYAIEELGFSEAEWFARVSLHDQDATQLLAYETIDNAKKKLSEIKWHFEENEMFRTLFPEIAYTGNERPWNNECLKIRRVGYGQRQEEGTFEAIGVNGALQSRHYKIVWEDDLVGMKATRSEAIMAETIRWHGLLHGAFENASDQIRFGVSNRWGYNDLNSHVRQNEPDFVFYTRAAWEISEETGQEVAIFPERYSMEALRKIENSGSMTAYDFSCQYLNDPQLPGEREAASDKLHKYTVDEMGIIKCSCGATFRPSQLVRMMHYDPFNAKGVHSTSCPAISVVGLATDKHIFVLDYYIAKGTYQQLYDQLFSMNDRWAPCKFSYEDVGHQNMTEHHIRSLEKTTEYKQAHRRFPPIVPIPTHNKAKEIRVREGLLPYIARGQVSYRDKQEAFRSQVDTFPNPCLSHDYDLLDCLAQGGSKDKNGILVWRWPTGEAEEITRKDEEQVLLEQLGKPYSQKRGDTVCVN